MPRKLLLSLLLLVPTLVHADDASKRTKIDEMLRLLNVEQTMNQVMDQSINQANQIAKSIAGDKPVPDADQKLLNDYIAKVTALTREQFGWQALRPSFVDLYASTYTEEEVDGMLAFYKSPVGQSMLAKQPELLTKSFAITQSRMQVLQPQLRQLTGEFQQKLAAQHGQPSQK